MHDAAMLGAVHANALVVVNIMDMAITKGRNMSKQAAMVRAQKVVLRKLGTMAGYEAEAMYKRYYLYYSGL